MLAGPAVIGWMTHVTALNHTFLLPALFCATVPTGLPGHFTVLVLERSCRTVRVERRQAHDPPGALLRRLSDTNAAVRSVAVVPGSTALNLMPGWDLAYRTVSLVAANSEAE